MTDKLIPSYETGRPMRLAGLRKFYKFAERSTIPKQWEAFGPHINAYPQQIGGIAYGVVLNPGGEDGFDYMTAVEIPEDADLPEDLVETRFTPARFAVFRHAGNLSTIMDTMSAIHRDFTPTVRGQCLEDVWMLERYGESFDPMTGDGGVDFMVPLKA